MMTIENQVIDFFKRKISKKIDKNSYITDYCKNEDDAYYLFLEFFSEFNIEQGNLNLDKYFYKKKPFYLFSFKKNEEEINKKKSISIKHLIEVAISKRWFDT